MILDKINKIVQSRISVNQWKDLSFDWFINIKNKESSWFIVFDIERFYPSISDNLFKSSIHFAKESIDFSDYDLSLINIAEKRYYFMETHPGSKKKGTSILMFLWVVLTGQKCAKLWAHTS